MGYVVGLGLKKPELKSLFQSDILLLRYLMSKFRKSTTFFFFIFLNPVANMEAEIFDVKVWEINNFPFIFFFLNPVANMEANYIHA